MLMGIGPSLGPRACIPEEKQLSLLHQLSAANSSYSSLGRGGTSRALPLAMLTLRLVRPCAALVLTVLDAKAEGNQ